MMFAAEFGTGQVLWSIVWFTLFVLWVSLVISVFGSIIRSRDMSGWAKGTWAIGVVFMPVLGVLLYMVIHGDSMSHGDSGPAQAQPRSTQSSDSTSEELAKLAALQESGALTADEYALAKARSIGA